MFNVQIIASRGGSRMKQRRRCNRIIILGLLALGLLAGAALTAPPAQAVDAVVPYYAEPAWDQLLPVATRFVVLTNWNSTAVLDKETGLVWERSPGTTRHPWVAARKVCTALTTGGRKGWRLPSIPELSSLADLQSISPFINGGGVFWTATSDAASPNRAWLVGFNLDITGSNGNGKNQDFRVWCVRGGNNADAY
jgi:hypothetical protein